MVFTVLLLDIGIDLDIDLDLVLCAVLHQFVRGVHSAAGAQRH